MHCVLNNPLQLEPSCESLPLYPNLGLAVTLSLCTAGNRVSTSDITLDTFPQALLSDRGFDGSGSAFPCKVPLYFTKIPSGGSAPAPNSHFLDRQKKRESLLQQVAFQHLVLFSYSLFPMLMTVPNRVFLSMLPHLVPVGFGSSQQLIFDNRSSAHNARRKGGDGRQVEARGGSKEDVRA